MSIVLTHIHTTDMVNKDYLENNVYSFKCACSLKSVQKNTGFSSRLLKEWKCDFLWRDREVEEDRTVIAERVGGGIYEFKKKKERKKTILLGELY